MVSYSTPLADTEFEDDSYDGSIGDRSMANGLGQLVDGILGGIEFLDTANSLTINDHHSNYKKKWVGWMGEGNASAPLEMLFEFVDYNQISAIFLHTSHFTTRAAKVRKAN